MHETMFSGKDQAKRGWGATGNALSLAYVETGNLYGTDDLSNNKI